MILFDGYAYVNGRNYFDISIDGFAAAQDGDINIKLGLMAGEGDRGIPGDFIAIQNADGDDWTKLSHDGNSGDNFFNSSIVTGGNVRNPEILNNTGLDIAMFDIPNENNTNIANSQTSTTFRYGTTRDVYSNLLFGYGCRCLCS